MDQPAQEGNQQVQHQDNRTVAGQVVRIEAGEDGPSMLPGEIHNHDEP